MNAEEQRLLSELSKGMRTTLELGGMNALGYLHDLWKRKAVAWDWEAERWRLPGPSEARRGS
jgi:hypothetical protein